MTNEIRRMNLQLGHFLPNNNWNPPEIGGIVQSTNPYLSVQTYGPVVDRIIFLAGIFIGAPIQSVISSVFYIIHSILALYNVLALPFEVADCRMEDKIVNIVFCILRVTLIQPVALFVFEGVCILGLFAPNNATKIYRAVETLAYGKPVLGSIFSPN